MSRKPTTPYHIDEQYADALLRPVGTALAELDERLTQFIDRLDLTTVDRSRVEQARDIIVDARRRLQTIVESPDADPPSKGSR